MFSIFARKLRVLSIKTPEEFINILPTWYSDEVRPEVKQLHCVWDWKSYFNPYMRFLEGHSFPHVFKAYKGADGNVLLASKSYHSRDDQFSNPIVLAPGMPDHWPSRILPSQIDESIQTDTLKASELFGEGELLQEYYRQLFASPFSEEDALLISEEMREWFALVVLQKTAQPPDQAEPEELPSISVSGRAHLELAVGRLCAFRDTEEGFLIGEIKKVNHASVKVQWYTRKGLKIAQDNTRALQRVNFGRLLPIVVEMKESGTLLKRCLKKIEREIESVE
jgi:hypothetical protein